VLQHACRFVCQHPEKHADPSPENRLADAERATLTPQGLDSGSLTARRKLLWRHSRFL